MRKRILGTIIAAGFFAVAAFAGANGLAETQAACETFTGEGWSLCGL